MKSLWNAREAARFTGHLGLRVYTSRLLGRDPELVLHGGGNTSVKVREPDLFGEEEDILYVKGSGWDLATIEAEGFAPVRLAHVQKLATLESLSDPEMVNQLRTAMTRASAPTPSVEAILHAVLPYRFVDHTHADALLALSNTVDGESRIRDTYGESVVVIPYTMPGFALARLCAERFPREVGTQTIGLVLLNHGLFSFGEDARESYERTIELVTRAERHLARHGAWSVPRPSDGVPEGVARRAEIAALRREVAEVAGFPVILSTRKDARIADFLQRPDLADLTEQGPITPDHSIRTKRVPQIGRDVRTYAERYRAYFEAHSRDTSEPLTMLDPAPRVILDPQLGLCTVGRSVRDAHIVADIYAHTMDVVERAAALGGYRALPSARLFEVEYWDLEQAKLRRAGPLPPFAGEVTLVTGAASGIGRACVEALRARGATVIGLDIDPDVRVMHTDPGFLGLVCDVRESGLVREALETAVRAFGGLDMLILNAGVFPATHRIDSLPPGEWRAAMTLNLDANLALMQETYPLLRLAPRCGRVVVIGSKNVPAPGPGAAAYSASKAALVQLARVAALEWGSDAIRVNCLHPDAVFDTGLWSEEVLRSRAAQYGLSVEAYRRKNVLATEVTSAHVGELAAEMCGPAFSRTTGAQVPVDGGNERVI